MEDQQLIAQLKELKNISPRKEWVILAKNEILNGQASFAGFWTKIPAMMFQKKYAYAFAALAILLVGSITVMQLPGNSGVKVASPAALVLAKNNVAEFKVKSKELSMVSKSDAKGFSLAVNDVNAVAKQLTQAIQSDPGVAREVALEINNNKTYLDVESSAELKATSNDLYKIVVEQIVSDLGKTSLTESQQEALNIAKGLYAKEKYTDALESILLLSMAIKNN
ncbi:MAG: hypothetical protein EXS48_01045 [Candidatus Staskawiczbacteria bacterium]|nr:hypothetical protein [Candidatus Staskawiczbacteria bacterium]